MPKVTSEVETDLDRTKELLSRGGLNPMTLKKRESVVTLFEEFLQRSHGLTLDLALQTDDLEDKVIGFLQNLKKNDGKMLSKNYFDTIVSHLKMKILELSMGHIDIGGPSFNRLRQIVKGIWCRSR